MTVIPLKQIRVETPCGADWEGMAGTDKVRFCAGCRKDVYNLSAMSQAEAQQTLARPNVLPCVRFHHDAAGAPLTREEMPARRRFLGRAAVALLALAGLTAPRSAAAAPTQGAPPALGGVPALMGAVEPPRPPKRPLMGKIKPPPRPHHLPVPRGERKRP